MTDQRGVLADAAEAADTVPEGAVDEPQEAQPDDEEYVDLIDEPAADASDVADPNAVVGVEDLPDEVRDGDIGAIEPEEI